MSKILVPLAQGFEEIEAVTIIDILRRANNEVTTCSLDSKLEVLGAHNIVIKADISIEFCKDKEFDMVVLPGGAQGTQNLASNTQVQTLLKEFKQKDKFIAAICAAPYALHKADVLNKNYTCYPSFEEKISLDGYSTQAVVSDDKVITSRGPATAMLFALELVRVLNKDEVYTQLKADLLL